MFKEKTPDMQPLVFWEKEDAQQTLRGFKRFWCGWTDSNRHVDDTPAGDGIVPEITAEEKFESISVKQTRL